MTQEGKQSGLSLYESSNLIYMRNMFLQGEMKELAETVINVKGTICKGMEKL